MLPIILDLRGRKALVVGGGRIAYRKALSLAEEGAHVTVVSPNFVDDFSTMPNSTLIQRTFEPGDTHGFQLVITATGNHEVDQMIYDEANARGTWVNSADDPDRCSFYLAATHRDGNVIVAVSTEGKSPALASHLRNTIAEQLPNNLANIALELDRQRSEIKNQGVSTESINWGRRIREALSPVKTTKTRRQFLRRG
ncbi:MAG: bifunctional precorrin-2 dehydrogenase/sirohydrochlorin ferrochelatase [Actinobacteria bacterium]|nr:bifunctional precorrin-2 dehydrogenase/sirohydrochlorin ferrochelatase [Actinomycetota bacterium]